MKFLVDECLSPRLATLARERGHPESTHVTWLGLTSAKDWTIARRAVDDGFVLVTNNAADFTALYGCQELHVGLVCLNAVPRTMSLDLQRRLFLLALAELGGTEPLNEVLADYPGLAREDLAACLAYARDLLKAERVYPTAA